MSDSEAKTRVGKAAILEDLRQQILDGRLPDGVRLPTENELATTYGASRTTVRSALEQLRDDQLVLSRQGSGNFVAGRSDSDPPTIRLELSHDFDEIFQLRRLLDGQAAAQAAANRDETDLDLLQRSIEDFEEQLNSEAIDMLAIRRADILFHQAVAEASRNQLLIDLISSFAPTVVPYWRAWFALPEPARRQLVADTLDEHRLIASAINASAQEVAEAAMRRHFQTNHDRYLRLFGRLPKELHQQDHEV
ncbi:MAG: FCD domain-containing protein [Pseudomonadota bacterium]